MHHSSTSHSSPRTSPSTTTAGSTSADLSKGSLSTSVWASRLSMKAMTDALGLLGASPVRAALFERHDAIRKGELKLPSESVEPSAILKISTMTLRELEDAFTSLVHECGPFFQPLPNYLSLLNTSKETGLDVRQRGVTNACSLLSQGTIPTEEALAHAQSLRLSLIDTKFDTVRSVLPIGLSISVALVSTVAPWWGTLTAGCVGLFACAAFASRLSYRNEVAAGLQLELLDAHRTLESGSVPALGDVLNKTFNDPSDPKSYGNLLRVEGFLIARTLRVLGHSQDEIFQLFNDSPTSYSMGEPLAEMLKASLAQHDISAPNYLFPSFVVDQSVKTRDEKLSELVEVMNQVHFEWALVEKDMAKERFAEILLRAGSTEQ